MKTMTIQICLAGIFSLTTLLTQAELDGEYAGEYKIRGNAYLYLDGNLAASKWNAAKTGWGDSLNRSIGINRHPTAAAYNQGFLYDPAIYLGVGIVPPPRSSLIFMVR
ncbi:MAG: hypothetical protein PHO37_06145 [Kiritimatiellae bacterium]|nr:hypothetical protein [Kiritimatiellia bacterium]